MFSWALSWRHWILFFLFVAALRHMECPGQGSDPSCNCSLCHSCCNARASTHCARWGGGTFVPALQRWHIYCCATAGTPTTDFLKRNWNKTKRYNYNTKCRQGYGAAGTLIRWWWECQMVQTLWETVWQCLTKSPLNVLSSNCSP